MIIPYREEITPEGSKNIFISDWITVPEGGIMDGSDDFKISSRKLCLGHPVDLLLTKNEENRKAADTNKPED